LTFLSSFNLTVGGNALLAYGTAGGSDTDGVRLSNQPGCKWHWAFAGSSHLHAGKVTRSNKARGHDGRKKMAYCQVKATGR